MLRVLLLLLCTLSADLACAGEGETGHPLAGFERLVGGQWCIEGACQEFSWGVGRQSVTGRGYFQVGGESKLVSEGSWYWHPAEQQIKGVFTAVDMPVVLFEYTTRFEENKMLSELRSYDREGAEYHYLETYEFTSPETYEWTLFRHTEEGLQREMGATYTRRSSDLQ